MRFDFISLIRLQKHSCSCLKTGMTQDCAKIHIVLVVTTSFLRPTFHFCIPQDQQISRCQGAPRCQRCNYKLRLVHLHPIKPQ